LDPNALRMLEEISKGTMKQLQPSINFLEPKVSYPSAENLMKTTSKQTEEILESLTKEGILKRKLFDKMLKCPECGSLNLKFSMLCSHCRSPDLSREEVVEHFSCGYSGSEREFRGETGKYACPKCGKELKSIGVDYVKLGLLYICRSCGERFSEPEQNWRCLKCSRTFLTAELKETNVYSYEFNEEKGDWLSIQFRYKRRVEELLREMGYKVLSNWTVKGKSGIEHPIDLFATDGALGEKIVIFVCEEADFEKIVCLHAIVEDFPAHPILITQKPLTEEMRRLAETLKVSILKEEDLETARKIFDKLPPTTAA